MKKDAQGLLLPRLTALAHRYNMWPGLRKQVLSTQNTPIRIMVHISFSVYAIQIL